MDLGLVISSIGTDKELRSKRAHLIWRHHKGLGCASRGEYVPYRMPQYADRMYDAAHAAWQEWPSAPTTAPAS